MHAALTYGREHTSDDKACKDDTGGKEGAKEQSLTELASIIPLTQQDLRNTTSTLTPMLLTPTNKRTTTSND